MTFLSKAFFFLPWALMIVSSGSASIETDRGEKHRKLKKVKKPKASKAPKGPTTTCLKGTQSDFFLDALRNPATYTTNPSVWICAGETMTLSTPFTVTLPSTPETCTNYKVFVGCLGGSNCVIQYIGSALVTGIDAVVDYSSSAQYATIAATLQGITLTSSLALGPGNGFVNFPGLSTSCGASTVTGTWTAGTNVLTPFLFGK